MELKQAILARHSVRGFLDKPIPQDTLRQVLELGTRSVTANNYQPWEILAVTGDPLEQLRRSNMADLDSGLAMDYASAPAHGIYKERSRENGKALFAAMEIGREDREKRDWWGRRGLRFFDAPAVLLLCMDKSLDTNSFRLDIGSLAQNICLAALEYGLGTCVEDQAIYYQRGIREILRLPENKLLITGIAIGYPDEAFPANHVRSPRAPLDTVTTWYGF